MFNTTIKVISMLFLVFLLSCNSDKVDTNSSGNNNEQPGNEKPAGSNKAVAVYNQAYQENYQEDKISYIIDSAKNAYVLLDPFQNNVPKTIPVIKANGNMVGGYISIGSGEKWRADFSELEPFLVSKMWGEWDGEYFVNITTTGIVDVMKARIDSMAKWGCDWVEFDNMDWVFDDDNRTEYGFQVSIEEGKAYYEELCEYVHQKGMKCMAKNMENGSSDFDGVIYELGVIDKKEAVLE